MAHIDFEAKTDRELLILVAQKSNETVDHLARLNDKIVKHEKRLTILESGNCGVSKWRLSRDNWPNITMITSVLVLIVIRIGEYAAWW